MKYDPEKYGAVFEWLFIEQKLGLTSKVWKFTGQTQDLEKKEVSFKFDIIGEGEDVVSFILGNVGKLDDAIEDYEKEGKGFEPADMDGKEVAQIKFIVKKA